MKQKIVSVAKYLSPTRSHVSQHVKPLFANRDRNSIMHQGNANSVLMANKHYAKTAYQPNLRASKTHLRRPGVHSSELNSFTDDSDSYDAVAASKANEEALTPKVRLNTGIKPYNLDKAKNVRILNSCFVEDLDKNDASKIRAVEDI